MNLHQLEYLVATVDTGTMTAAAASLHVSQPALSRAVRALEHELGVTVLDRVGRRVVLTTEGERVVRVARRILADVESLHPAGPDVVRLGATLTQARELCAGAIARLAGTADLRVALTTYDSTEMLVEALDASRIDLAVADMPAPRHAHRQVLGVQELALVAPPDWELPCPFPLRRVSELALVVPSTKDRRRHELETALAAVGGRLQVAMEVDQRDLVLPLVLQGVGATLSWPVVAEVARRQGARVLPLDPPFRRQVGVLWTTPPRPATEPLLDALVEEARAALTPARSRTDGLEA